MLEVRDKQDKIVFAIKYSNWSGSPGVAISGYFIGDTSVSIINTSLNDNIASVNCIQKSDVDWKQKALNHINLSLLPEVGFRYYISLLQITTNKLFVDFIVHQYQIIRFPFTNKNLFPGI